jgi:hypothetical protein
MKHTHILSLSHALTHSLTHQMLAVVFRDTQVFKWVVPHTHTHTHSHTYFLSHTHSHTYFLSHTHSHTHTFSHTHTHTHTFSHTHTHTHTHSHTHTHTRCSYWSLVTPSSLNVLSKLCGLRLWVVWKAVMSSNSSWEIAPSARAAVMRCYVCVCVCV